MVIRKSENNFNQLKIVYISVLISILIIIFYLHAYINMKF